MANIPNTPSTPSNNPTTRTVQTYKSPYGNQIAAITPGATAVVNHNNTTPTAPIAGKPAWAKPTTVSPNHPTNPTTDTTQFVRNTDPRLMNERTPTPHATSHMVGGTDVIQPNGLVQTNFVKVTSDTVSPSTTFVSLVSTQMTTGNNALLITAAGHVSCSVANTNMNIRIVVDGTSVGGGQVHSTASNVANPFALQAAVSVTAGIHVISIEWKTSAGNIQCCPVSLNVDGECASIIIQEVTC